MTRTDALISGGGPDLPLITLTAGPGPTAVLTASVHGDEYTGTAAILQRLPAWERGLIRGRLALLPSLNPDGLRARERACCGEDLNRQFPGARFGGAAARHAARIWGALLRLQPIDLLLDLHADAHDALPYAILDPAVTLPPPERAALEARCLRLARATGLLCLREHDDARYTRARLDRSLSGAAVNLLRAPALTLEIGPRLTLDPAAPARMIAAVEGALRALGMLAPAPGDDPRDRDADLYRDAGPFYRDAGPRSEAGGILQTLVRPGQPCAPAQPVARLIPLTGPPETLLAPGPGFVVAWSDRPYVPPRAPCCTWASTSSGLQPSAWIVPSR